MGFPLSKIRVYPCASVVNLFLKMTQKEFDTLPALLSRKQLLAATGLGPHQIVELVREGDLRVWRYPRGKGKRKYYKADAARMTGYVLS